jgi:hypothetical protein
MIGPGILASIDADDAMAVTPVMAAHTAMVGSHRA